jgi:hypothetical protein
MDLVLLRHVVNGKMAYWHESLSSEEAFGLATRLESPEMVTITIPVSCDPVLLLSSLAVKVVPVR